MKPLLLLPLLVASNYCFGQTGYSERQKALAQKWKMENWTPSAVQPFAKPPVHPALQGYIAGRQVPAGVYRLPGSGMSCIVPDRLEIATMPNVFGPVSVPFKTTMPNRDPNDPGTGATPPTKKERGSK